MREQINTFETVFNVEQFLVRLVDSGSLLFRHLFTPEGRAHTGSMPTRIN